MTTCITVFEKVSSRNEHRKDLKSQDLFLTASEQEEFHHRKVDEYFLLLSFLIGIVFVAVLLIIFVKVK